MLFHLIPSQFSAWLFGSAALICLGALFLSHLHPLLLSLSCVWVVLIFVLLWRRYGALIHPRSFVALELISDPPGRLFAIQKQGTKVSCSLNAYHRGPGWYLLLGRGHQGQQYRFWLFFDAMGIEARCQLARYLLASQNIRNDPERLPDDPDAKKVQEK